MEIRKYFELNNNGNKPNYNLWDATETVLVGNSYLLKQILKKEKERKSMIIKVSISRKMENNSELNLNYKGKNNKYKNKNQ